MGIKNIHILLISAASLMGVLFGVWGITHGFTMLGIGAMVFAFCLVFYGVQFIKKARTL